MITVGIICEYNPLHLGHGKQLRQIRDRFGEDTAIVCLMSGNYVQRGAPAVFDKSLRAEAAVRCGADLVLELPVTRALSSAEGFAGGGVQILSPICDYLCFGAETADAEALTATARALLSPEFPPLLKARLETGISFPAARAEALAQMGLDSSLLLSPNNILAVEYCKAILAGNCSMKPLPIHRGGSYHDARPDPDNPSATALRRLIRAGQDWDAYTPVPEVFRDAPVHTLAAAQTAIVYRLRTMTDEEFEALPYGSEGLWRRFMHASRSYADLEQIIAATKSKRYTRSRIDRMVMCAFLGITREQLEAPVPYVRALAFRHRGRPLLRQLKQHLNCINAGQIPEDPYWLLEKRCSDLYGLFCTDGPEAPAAEEKQRIVYLP